MPKLITQNDKMKKASVNGKRVINFGITAYKTRDGFLTCPMAGECVFDCYAQQGSFTWSNTVNAYEWRTEQTKSKTFSLDYIKDLTVKVKTSKRKREKLFNRIHDSGDFYSLAYWLKWDTIIRAFPQVRFYAYSKNVPMFKRLMKENKLPENFTVIFSYGGKYDFLIDPKTDRHSRVFESEKDLKKFGYVNATKNDLNAIGKNHLVGLVYHGKRKFENTGWANCAA
jgi:hypothetical protein